MPRLLPHLAIAVPALLLSTAASAEDRGVVYTGGSAGNGYNLYGGAVVSLPGNALGKGLAIRGGASGGEYRYTSAGSRIEGRYLSGELALVYQTSGAWGWANFSAGPRVTDTKLSPFDPANKLSGTRWDAAVQSDGAVGKTWRLNWFGSLGVIDGTYITEVRFGPRVGSDRRTHLGVEGGVQGDSSYTQGRLGLFAATSLAPKTEGRISFGATDQAGRHAKPYVALGLSRTF